MIPPLTEMIKLLLVRRGPLAEASLVRVVRAPQKAAYGLGCRLTFARALLHLISCFMFIPTTRFLLQRPVFYSYHHSLHLCLLYLSEHFGRISLIPKSHVLLLSADRSLISATPLFNP